MYALQVCHHLSNTSAGESVLIASDQCVSDGGVYLLDSGVTHIFNCSNTLASEWEPPSPIQMYREHIVDRVEFSLESLCVNGLPWLHEALMMEGAKVVLLCSTGTRVTPAVVIAYRMLYHYQSFQEASAGIVMNINDGFYRQLIQLNELLRGPNGEMNRSRFVPHGDPGSVARQLDEKEGHGGNYAVDTYPDEDGEEISADLTPGPPPRADVILVKRDVKMSDLIERGYIYVGQEIIYKQRRNIVHIGTIINRFGVISYEDQLYDSPSLFVTNLLHSNGGSQRTKRNGWTAAHVAERTLDSLREELLAAQHVQPAEVAGTE